ncbi:hypothetical protein HPO96_12725 [Kribbella sandramycini]|uniref:Integral membrane protein n=1 Tax=Kribbella sandramycini TaxID=60450 RepID=A0A7Y4KYP1_9ACTN|nr:hypothetical protein [Kribbella sandramycini]
MRLDAVASGALGVLLAGIGSALEGPLGLPRELSLAAGAFLIVWALALLAIGRRTAINRTAVLVVVAVNAAWVIASVALLLGAFEFTGLGIAFVLAQAVAVAAFAGLQAKSLTSV